MYDLIQVNMSLEEALRQQLNQITELNELQEFAIEFQGIFLSSENNSSIELDDLLELSNTQLKRAKCAIFHNWLCQLKDVSRDQTSLFSQVFSLKEGEQVAVETESIVSFVDDNQYQVSLRFIIQYFPDSKTKIKVVIYRYEENVVI